MRTKDEEAYMLVADYAAYGSELENRYIEAQDFSSPVRKLDIEIKEFHKISAYVQRLRESNLRLADQLSKALEKLNDRSLF